MDGTGIADFTAIASGTATSMAIGVVMWVKAQEFVTTRRSMALAAVGIGIGAALVAALATGPLEAANWQVVALQAITACAAAMATMAPFPKPKRRGASTTPSPATRNETDGETLPAYTAKQTTTDQD